MLKTIIRDHMMDFLIKHKLINPSQHGFLKARDIIGDIIPDSEEGVKDVGQKEVWSLVNSKRKRARDREPAVASQGLSSPLPGSPPTGKLVIDETCSDDSERAKFKKKCNDASSDNDST